MSEAKRDSERPMRPLGDSEMHMAEIVMPNDANPHGTLSGGRLMHLIDIAGAMVAMRHSSSRVVTVAIDEVSFHEPVLVGFIIRLAARLTYAGRTSMEVKVEAESEDPLTGNRKHTTTAHLVYVAVDGEGKPREVPGAIAVTELETELMDRARTRRELRLARLRSEA